MPIILKSLGQFDVVYSWGVLHHTGDMWRALENALIPLAPGASHYIAIYNDQAHWSKGLALGKGNLCGATEPAAISSGCSVPGKTVGTGVNSRCVARARTSTLAGICRDPGHVTDSRCD